jgi:hypothetical protein
MRTFIHSPTGRVLQQGEAFHLGGLKFPANWLDLAGPEDLAPLGIRVDEAPDPAPVLPTLAEVKAGLLVKLDRDAERVRLIYITPGAGQAMTYQEKAEQANAVLDLGEEAANALTEAERVAQFQVLAASVGLEADTLFAAADLVMARKEAWASIGGVIERVRLAGKKAIGEAQTESAARQAYEGIRWPT